MATIHPIELRGNWLSGFALDFHTVSSACIGHDSYGRPIFETERTELGSLLYRLKFQRDKSVVNEVVETVAQFVQGTWRPPISVIVPMPPSDIRAEQPVVILAEALAVRLSLPVRHAVTKIKKTEQLKNIYDYGERMRTLEGAFSADPSLLAEQRVLLFDDLYRSGATMSSVAAVLREQGKALEIYALTLTRTRVNR